MNYKLLSEWEWQQLFQIVTPTLEAGTECYQAAVDAAKGTTLEAWELKRDYFNHLGRRYERLTAKQLIELWAASQQVGLPMEFILEHYRNYLK